MVPLEPNTPRLALVMVGLPARGKSYVAQKISRYLCWRGHRTQVFNVGAYRRERLGSHTNDFFDPANQAGRDLLLSMATAALDDMLRWLRDEGQVAIYDATNSTRSRRQMVRERCEREGVQVVFIESICDDEAVIDANVRETKVSSPDYAGVDPEQAVQDFRARIAHYERAYETIDDDTASYIKVIDVGRQIVINRIHGYLPGRVVFFLMNLHTRRRPIWLTRHGESTHNVEGLIGGDSDLSPRGEGYARSLADLLDLRLASEGGILWTSSLRRTRQTARHFTSIAMPWRALDEIDAGICDGLSYVQIAERLPEEYRARAADKFRYRYPGGESYEDVIHRLDPVIIELERQTKPVLIVAHQAVLRALYAYLMDRPAEQCHGLEVPLHTVIELVPRAYGCEERRIPLLPTTPQERSSIAPLAK
jgi:broad specificity phosphatase PhoE/predicted kinase